MLHHDTTMLNVTQIYNELKKLTTEINTIKSSQLTIKTQSDLTEVRINGLLSKYDVHKKMLLLSTLINSNDDVIVCSEILKQLDETIIALITDQLIFR